MKPGGFVCPGCGKPKAWELQIKRWTWECATCGRQTSVTAGTIMHHSKLPLTTWFWAAYLMATHSNGISALQLQRQLGLGSYRSAWLLCGKLRHSMVASGRTALAGLVEIDETEIPCRSKNDPVTGGGGRSHQGKMLIVGAVEVQRRPRPHPPEQGVRLLGRQSASLHRRQPRTRRHCQDRRLVRLSRRSQRQT